MPGLRPLSRGAGIRIGVADRAAKRTWDRLRTATVPVLQHYAGQPTNDEGQALSTVGEFQAWWHDHKELRDPAWKD